MSQGVNVGSPITVKDISAIADGRAGFSIGWGMLFSAKLASDLGVDVLRLKTTSDVRKTQDT